MVYDHFRKFALTNYKIGNTIKQVFNRELTLIYFNIILDLISPLLSQKKTISETVTQFSLDKSSFP